MAVEGVPIREHAPAKLNLYLEVTGRRADGYHTLESLVGFVDVADVVEIRPADTLSLGIHGLFAATLADEPPETNLVLRAARAFAGALGREPDVAIRLEKRLPVASGVGGGSADAAAALRGLARLWQVPQGDPRMLRIARGLGQDVPACLACRPCRFRGIGDVTEPLTAPLPPLSVLLVNPRQPLATPAVFSARTGPFSAPRPFGLPASDAAGFVDRLSARRNDLTSAAIALVPAVQTVLEALAALSGCRLARMSGSGATCFGLFLDPAQARDAAARLSRESPDWWIADGVWYDPD